jgi:mono/diheme cytochrome c family protein
MVILALFGCDFFRGYARGDSVQLRAYQTAQPAGFYRLLFDDFQGLDTDTLERSAAPWKFLAAATVAMRGLEPSESAYVAFLQREYGFLVPARIVNWPRDAPQIPWRRPLGMVSGTIRRSLPNIELEAANTGCATCHASNLFDAEGNPTPEVAYLGAAATSINLEGYARNAFEAVRWATRNKPRFWQTVERMFPAISAAERDTLQRFVFPKLEERVEELERTTGGFTPYDNGGPGLTNGAATIQFYLGLFGRDRYRDDQVAFTAMPDLSALRLRKSFLADGVYAPRGWEHFGTLESPGSEAHRNATAGLISLVTFTTLGVPPERAVKNRARVRDVIDWIFDAYVPPPFPGRIDEVLADKGEELFRGRCEGCHGRYQRNAAGRYVLTAFPNRLSRNVGTDPARQQVVTGEVLHALEATALGEVLDAEATGGYVATPLGGLWASAPYLHNGSVPSLWALMNPEQRPAQFEVGGHKLDFEAMGVSYPEGYQPWSKPVRYDTTKPGRSNRGHEAQFSGLDSSEKRALIEFLKRL